MDHITPRVLDVINKKGWLAISYLTFDNSINCNIFRCGGKVTISTKTNTCYWMQTMDTTDSSFIEHVLISTNPCKFGQDAILVESDMDCLQHVAYSMYGHTRFFDAEGDSPIPYPAIPSASTIQALKKDETTGLYNTDGVIRYDHTVYGNTPVITEQSAIPFYEKFDKDLETLDSFALVDGWKSWYDTHDKFVTMVQEYFGITGCV